MFVSRVLSRVSRSVCQSYTVLFASQSPHHLPNLSNDLHSLVFHSPKKLIPVQVKSLHPTINSSSTPRSLFFSTTSPNPDEKEETKTDQTESSGQAEAAEQTKESEILKKLQNFGMSLLDVVDNLGRALLVTKHKFTKLDASKESNGAVPLLKTLLEGVETTEKQFAEVFKKLGVAKFDSEHESDPDRRDAILQFHEFRKNLLDVADNLGRASSVVKDKFTKIDASKESNEAVPLLKTLIEGVEMTQKQLEEVLNKVGFEKFDSKREPYDPDRHDAILQFQVSSQPPGTIVAVVKAGYMLDGRVIRRAEVAITREVEDEDRDEEESAYFQSENR